MKKVIIPIISLACLFAISGCFENVTPAKKESSSIDAISTSVAPESIELVDLDNKMILSNPDGPITDADGNIWNYWFVYHEYAEGSSVRIKANIKPSDSLYPNVTFVKDQQNTSFDMETKESNSDIDENIAIFKPNDKIDSSHPAMAAKFKVISQNPGIKITINACIVFALY